MRQSEAATGSFISTSKLGAGNSKLGAQNSELKLEPGIHLQSAEASGNLIEAPSIELGAIQIAFSFISSRSSSQSSSNILQHHLSSLFAS